MSVPAFDLARSWWGSWRKLSLGAVLIRNRFAQAPDDDNRRHLLRSPFFKNGVPGRQWETSRRSNWGLLYPDRSGWFGGQVVGEAPQKNALSSLQGFRFEPGPLPMKFP